MSAGFTDAASTARKLEAYLRSKPDREIAALLLQEVLPELSSFGPASQILESAIDRLARSSAGALTETDAGMANRVALEESDAGIDLFQFTF